MLEDLESTPIGLLKNRWKARINIMLNAGIHLPKVECGVRTWNMIVAMVVADTHYEEIEAVRRRIESGQAILTFAGLQVICCVDVPDGNLWPPREVSPFASRRRIEVPEDAKYVK